MAAIALTAETLIIFPLMYALLFGFIVGSTNEAVQDDLDMIGSDRPSVDYWGTPITGCSADVDSCGLVQSLGSDLGWLSNVTGGLAHLPQSALIVTEFCMPAPLDDQCNDGSFLSTFNIGMFVFGLVGMVIRFLPILIDMVKAIAQVLEAVIPF